jgi:diacylglycerol kinase
VFVAELLNTALEYTVDIASPEKREMARRAKDISAAAVLVTATCSVIVGLLIFLPKILPLLGL